MTPETVEETPKGMGEVSRVAGVLFEPKKTFEDIARRPTFVLPMLLVIVFTTVYLTQIGQRIGWDRIARQRIETSSRAQQQTAEQKEQGIAIAVKISNVTQYVGPLVLVIVGDLIIAGILLGIVAGIMSAPVKFKQVFAAVAWSGMPGVFVAILSIVVVYLKNPDDFNINNPLAFNPAAFMDPQTGSKFLYSFASSIDFFSLWTIFLLAAGLKAAGGKKLSFGGALFSVVLPWGVYVLAKSALAGVFG